MAEHGYTGWVAVQKRSGTVPGGVAVGAQRNILMLEANPDNPDNNSYMNVINAGGYPNSAVAGRGTPQCELHTFLKAYQSQHVGWSDAAIFKSWLGLGNDNNGDVFDVAFKGETSLDVYDWSRCTMVEFSAAAVGGPIATRIGFASRWGDSECPYGTTLPSGEVIAAQADFVTLANTSPDPGLAANVINMAITGFSQVKSFNLLILRPQPRQFHFNGDRGCENTSSGQLSGLLTIEQEKDADLTIETTGAATFKFCTDFTAATGRFKVDLLLKRDRRVTNRIPGIVPTIRTFSLFDQSGGGNPAVFSAY